MGQATHGQRIDALNLLQAQTPAAAEVENKLRGHFQLQNKKRVVRIEMDAETYQLWLSTKAKLKEPADSRALKKLCESHGKSSSKKI